MAFVMAVFEAAGRPHSISKHDGVILEPPATFIRRDLAGQGSPPQQNNMKTSAREVKGVAV